MKKLRITILVGTSLRKDGLRISGGALCAMCARAEKFFMETCGGFTCHNGNGGWRETTANGFTDWRETSVSYVFIVDPGAVCPKALAEWVRDNFEQKTVVLTVEEITCAFI